MRQDGVTARALDGSSGRRTVVAPLRFTSSLAQLNSNYNLHHTSQTNPGLVEGIRQ